MRTRLPLAARPLQEIVSETSEGFAWLCRGLSADERVTLVCNPGNIGDALINLSCHRYLASRFNQVSLCSVGENPRTDIVFVAGGGNLIEGLYTTIADFVVERCDGRRLLFFPSSVKGFGAWLDRLAGRARMICREAASFAHVRSHLAVDDVLLGHDAAFSSAGAIRSAFADAILRHPPAAARFLRRDRERVHELAGDGDIMDRKSGDWIDLAEAGLAVSDVARTLLQFGRIYTDRLHCAILAAMLDRYVVLMPNAYFKNAAVFEHSLHRLANVRFEDRPGDPPSRQDRTG